MRISWCKKGKINEGGSIRDSIVQSLRCFLFQKSTMSYLTTIVLYLRFRWQKNTSRLRHYRLVSLGAMETKLLLFWPRLIFAYTFLLQIFFSEFRQDLFPRQKFVCKIFHWYEKIHFSLLVLSESYFYLGFFLCTSSYDQKGHTTLSFSSLDFHPYK